MNILHLVLLMVLNMIDYLMFYLIGKKLINEKISSFTIKTGIKMIVFGVTYGIFIGKFAYAVQYNNIGLYIFRIVATILLIFVSKTIGKKTFGFFSVFFHHILNYSIFSNAN